MKHLKGQFSSSAASDNSGLVLLNDEIKQSLCLQAHTLANSVSTVYGFKRLMMAGDTP